MMRFIWVILCIWAVTWLSCFIRLLQLYLPSASSCFVQVFRNTACFRILFWLIKLHDLLDHFSGFSWFHFISLVNLVLRVIFSCLGVLWPSILLTLSLFMLSFCLWISPWRLIVIIVSTSTTWITRNQTPTVWDHNSTTLSPSRKMSRPHAYDTLKMTHYRY